MSSFIKQLVFLISLKFIFVCNAQTWSAWTSCSMLEGCQNKTELNCDNGKGVQCLQNGLSPYQIALSSACSGNCDVYDDSQWEGSYILLSCRGNCYDAMQINESFCKTIQACKRHQYHRCYNEQTCRGIWNETSSQCSSSCGGGTRSVITTCVNQNSGERSSNCNGTFYGTYNQLNITQPCNTHACPTWSSWSELTSCSVTCGNGTQTSNSTCMHNGTVSSMCEGNNTQSRIRQSSCNIQSCPSWSSWSEFTSCSVTCGNGTQTSNSTCMHNGTASSMCEGNNTQSRIRKNSCNIQSCPSWSSWREITSCTAYCENGTQTFTSVCMYNNTVSKLCSDPHNETSRTNTTQCSVICKTTFSTTRPECKTLCENQEASNSLCNCDNGFPVLYVAIGSGGFLLIIIIAIIAYVVVKKQKSSKIRSSNELTSNVIYGSCNLGKHSDTTANNVDAVMSDSDDLYAEIDNNNKKETMSSICNQDTHTVASKADDVCPTITENNKPDTINQEVNNEDTDSLKTDDVYAIVDKTKKAGIGNVEKNQDESMHVTIESGDVYAVVEKK